MQVRCARPGCHIDAQHTCGVAFVKKATCMRTPSTSKGSGTLRQPCTSTRSPTTAGGAHPFVAAGPHQPASDRPPTAAQVGRWCSLVGDARAEVAASPFYASLRTILAAAAVLPAFAPAGAGGRPPQPLLRCARHLVVWGLGSLGCGLVHIRYQLALALLLRGLLGGEAAAAEDCSLQKEEQVDVEVYDPVFSALDRAVLQEYSIRVRGAQVLTLAPASLRALPQPPADPGAGDAKHWGGGLAGAARVASARGAGCPGALQGGSSSRAQLPASTPAGPHTTPTNTSTAAVVHLVYPDTYSLLSSPPRRRSRPTTRRAATSPRTPPSSGYPTASWSSRSSCWRPMLLRARCATWRCWATALRCTGSAGSSRAGAGRRSSPGPAAAAGCCRQERRATTAMAAAAACAQHQPQDSSSDSSSSTGRRRGPRTPSAGRRGCWWRSALAARWRSGRWASAASQWHPPSMTWRCTPLRRTGEGAWRGSGGLLDGGVMYEHSAAYVAVIAFG